MNVTTISGHCWMALQATPQSGRKHPVINESYHNQSNINMCYFMFIKHTPCWNCQYDQMPLQALVRIDFRTHLCTAELNDQCEPENVEKKVVNGRCRTFVAPMRESILITSHGWQGQRQLNRNCQATYHGIRLFSINPLSIHMIKAYLASTAVIDHEYAPHTTMMRRQFKITASACKAGD
jgi:hypothetical protein